MARRLLNLTFEFNSSFRWAVACALVLGVTACGKFGQESSHDAALIAESQPSSLGTPVEQGTGFGANLTPFSRALPSDVSALFAQDRIKSDKVLIRESQKRTAVQKLKHALQSVRVLNQASPENAWPPSLVVAAATMDLKGPAVAAAKNESGRLEIPELENLKVLLKRLASEDSFASLRTRLRAEGTTKNPADALSKLRDAFAVYFEPALRPAFIRLATQVALLEQTLDTDLQRSKGVTP